MITKWLEEKKRSGSLYTFQVINVTEKNNASEEAIEYIGERILNAYRSAAFLKTTFQTKHSKELIKYLKEYVFPAIDGAGSKGEITIRKNVRQGDFGETISIELIEKFRKLHVPVSKLRWKFNNNRSVFCTDIFAHDRGNNFSELKYYEVKTRTTFNKQICIEAHNSLAKDIPHEFIADFLQRHYYELAEEMNRSGRDAKKYYDICAKYNDILSNPDKYIRSFEIILIMEKKNFQETILKALDDLPPSLSPLEITIILIDDVRMIIDKSYKKAIAYALTFVYGNKK